MDSAQLPSSFRAPAFSHKYRLVFSRQTVVSASTNCVSHPSLFYLTSFPLTFRRESQYGLAASRLLVGGRRAYMSMRCLGNRSAMPTRLWRSTTVGIAEQMPSYGPALHGRGTASFDNQCSCVSPPVQTFPVSFLPSDIISVILALLLAVGFFTIIRHRTTATCGRESSIPFLDFVCDLILVTAPLSEVTIMVPDEARSAIHLSIISALASTACCLHTNILVGFPVSLHWAPIWHSFPLLFPTLQHPATTVSVILQRFCPSSHIGFLSCFKWLFSSRHCTLTLRCEDTCRNIQRIFGIEPDALYQ